jgi:hypothetical protein
MGVGVGADQHGKLDAVGADLVHQVAQDREGRHDLGLGLREGGQCRERRGGRQEMAPEDHRPSVIL